MDESENSDYGEEDKKEEQVEYKYNLPAKFDETHSSEFNRSHNLVLFPKTPSITQKESCVVGIDEAGRGPVLGPMVYGICYCPESKQDLLASLGFSDSKQLSEMKRNELLQTMMDNSETIGRGVEVLSPNYISICMLARDRINLNLLSHNTAIRMIRKLLARGVKISKILLDTVGDAKSYQEKLIKEFEGKLKIEVHIKADSKFPIVGAASICAKVMRDWCLTNWVYPENMEFTEGRGSGYTGDPNTKAWLGKNVDAVFGYPNLVRFGWSTCRKKLEKAFKVEWEDEEDCDIPKLESFFGKNKNKEHPFFTERFLQTPKSI